MGFPQGAPGNGRRGPREGAPRREARSAAVQLQSAAADFPNGARPRPCNAPRRPPAPPAPAPPAPAPGPPPCWGKFRGHSRPQLPFLDCRTSATQDSKKKFTDVGETAQGRGASSGAAGPAFGSSFPFLADGGQRRGQRRGQMVGQDGKEEEGTRQGTEEGDLDQKKYVSARGASLKFHSEARSAVFNKN